jgi:hypothetical protein
LTGPTRGRPVQANGYLILNRFACAVSDGIIDNMRAIPTVLVALLIGVSSPSIGKETFTLLCHVVPAASLEIPPFDTNFLVDADTSTVDGSYASIRDDIILWESTTKKGTSFSLRIDRRSGTMMATDRESGKILWTGICEKPR